MTKNADRIFYFYEGSIAISAESLRGGPKGELFRGRQLLGLPEEVWKHVGI
jgi:hypothetical protein